MRCFYLLAFAFISFHPAQALCQESHVYEKVIAIDTSKQDGNKKLLLLYGMKQTLEHSSQPKDTGYILALLKIAKYESDVNNNVPKAITLATQALQMLQSSKWHNPTLLANAYYNLAGFYYNIRVYDQAKFFYEKIIEISDAGHVQDFYLEAKMYDAAIDDLLGDYEKVEKESLLAMAEAAKEQDMISYNRLLYLHSRALLFQNQPHEALTEARQIELQAKQSGDTFFLANAYNLQAKIFDNYKNYKVAEPLYKLAVSTRQPLLDNDATSIDYSDLANFYGFSLHDYQKAEACYKKSILYAEKNNAERKARLLLMAYTNLGELYVEAYKYDEAIAWLSRALNVVNIKLPDFSSANPSVKQLSAVGEKELILLTLTTKCKLILELYNKTKNQAYLQQCISTATTADSLVVQMRHEQAGDKSKLYWRDKTHSFFSKAMDACYLSGNADKALFFMEKSRSVLLNDKLSELNSSLSYLPQQTLLTENGLANDIAELQTKLISLSASSPGYTNTLETLDNKQDALNRYIKSLEKKYPQYYQYKYADDVPSMAAVKEYLANNNQSLVYYFAGDSAMYVLGITKNKTSFIKVPVQSFDNRQLLQFTNLCSNRQESNSNYAMVSSLAHNIYQKIFEPLHLAAGNVTICTDNFFIPFDALCSDTKGKQFLLYNYQFSYAYSARTLLKPFESHTKPEGNFIGFAPVSFSKKLNVVPLNKSAVALQKVADCYQSSLLFTDQNAKRANFFKESSKYAVLTIFSHAQADTTDKEPVLYMQDSLIHLSELQLLSNSATQFVLLSACQTNTGKNATGEGIYSLARGFAAAGIPSVSATLWKADEEAVYSISTKFNEYLAKGMNKNDALQQAKIWYLQNSDREHALPYYWANMVLIGSAIPISFTQTNHDWIWLVVTLVIILPLSTIFLYRYKKRNTMCNFNKENQVVNGI